jgi:hypothetical protein
MSKPKMTVAQWLGDKFKNSFKTLSETLSTEQFNEFVQEAGALQPDNAEETGEGNQGEGAEGSQDPKNAAPAGPGPESTDLQAQVQALTTKLEVANTALASEKKAHEATTAQLTAANAAKSAAEATSNKLRQAVNPLGNEDLVNQDPEKRNQGLTKTDIEAREAYKKRHSKA